MKQANPSGRILAAALAWISASGISGALVPVACGQEEGAPDSSAAERSAAAAADDVDASTAASAAPSSAAPASASPAFAWGALPARGDSASATLSTRPSPAWAKILDAPYLVATYPIHLAGRIAEEGVELSDRIGLSHALASIFARRVLPPYTAVGLRVGGEDGFGGTFAVAYPKMPGRGDTFRLKLEGTTGGDRGAAAGASWGTTEHGQLEVGGGYRQRANFHFYGIGAESEDDDESIYLEESAYGGASVTRSLPHGFGAKGIALWSAVAARGTFRDHDPALSEVFEGRLPAGFRERSDGVTLSLELEHDDAPEATRPERGGLRRALVAGFRDTAGDDLRYWTWRAEAQQFLPLWFSKRSLALRAFVTKIEPEGDAEVPLQRLFTNDDPDLLRGYSDHRFRDLGLAVATAEYRWPVWAVGASKGLGVDAVIFTDVGQVFREVGEIGDELTTSWGAGLRLGSFEEYRGRIEFAHGEEGNEIRLRFDQLFQYDKGGFLRTRHPVPDR